MVDSVRRSRPRRTIGRAIKRAIGRAIDRAIEIAGSEDKLGKAIGWSQVTVNKAKKRGTVSPEMAKAIHRFTDGRVPGSEMRPDLWRRPKDVPIERAP